MPERLPRVLLVDDDQAFRHVFGGALVEEGFEVLGAANGREALEQMNRQAIDLALVDLRMPVMDGLCLLTEMERRQPEIIPIVFTGYGTVSAAVEAMRSGAFDVLGKATPVEKVVGTLRQAMEERRRALAQSFLGEAFFERECFFGIVGRSPGMRAVYRSIERLWNDIHPVLVQGESGTGKELAVRAIHGGGGRRDKPFVTVNCASLKENFVDNELFGHVRGAYTGAVTPKKGLFELADGGTLFIDEVGEMPERVQASLLRVIETGTFRPLGATEEVKVDVRLVAATNRDIDADVETGQFRKDLFYRLCVGRIDLPPLRERPEDLPLLISHFLERSSNARRLCSQLTQAAVDAITKHSWPGNVRELLNTLERAVLLARDRPVLPSDLGLGPPPANGNGRPEAVPAAEEDDLTLDQLERAHVERLLEREGGNITRVSKILDVDPTTLRRKIRRWRVER